MTYSQDAVWLASEAGITQGQAKAALQSLARRNAEQMSQLRPVRLHGVGDVIPRWLEVSSCNGRPAVTVQINKPLRRSMRAFVGAPKGKFPIPVNTVWLRKGRGGEPLTQKMT